MWHISTNTPKKKNKKIKTPNPYIFVCSFLVVYLYFLIIVYIFLSSTLANITTLLLDTCVYVYVTLLVCACRLSILICQGSKARERMADWGPVVIAVVLFVLLSPGLLFQLPGKNRVVEFGNMQTSGLSILVHTIIFFGLITIFLIAIGVHIYTGWYI